MVNVFCYLLFICKGQNIECIVRKLKKITQQNLSKFIVISCVRYDKWITYTSKCAGNVSYI